jgi:hypothetical protein
LRSEGEAVKLKRIASIPFALAADIVTLGNMGDRSFTQQVFDDERREQRAKEEEKAVLALIELIKAINK